MRDLETMQHDLEKAQKNFNAAKETREKIEKELDRFKESFESHAWKTLKEDPTYKDLFEQFAHAATAEQDAQSVLAIEKDNAVAVTAESCVAIAERVLKEFDGKKLGPATEKKIQEKITSETGIHCYIGHNYDGKANTFEFYGKNYSDRFNLTTTKGFGNFTNNENKIDFESVGGLREFKYSPLYCDNAKERYKELTEKLEQAKAAFMDLERITCEYNALKTGSIEGLETYNMSKYSFSQITFKH